jgi:hypothetical protein
LQSDIAKEQAYQALNVAKGIGRIHIIDKLDEHVEIGFNEILVLDEVPVQLPPSQGLLPQNHQPPVAHQPARERLGHSQRLHQERERAVQAIRHWWVTFETNRDNYSVKRADLNQLHEYQRRLKERLDVVKPRFDLSEKRLLTLAQQRKT